MRHLAACSLLLLAASAAAQVNVRVVDTGHALCGVARIPPYHDLVYDAGATGAFYDGINELVPEGARIDMLVLSHTDADHIGSVVKLVDWYDIRRVLCASCARASTTERRVEIAIPSKMAEYELGPMESDPAFEHSREHREPALWLHVMPLDSRRDINLEATEFAPASTWCFGEALAIFVTGNQDRPCEGLVSTIACLLRTRGRT
jgi:hypothetical protein